jgi:hypothetical protein
MSPAGLEPNQYYRRTSGLLSNAIHSKRVLTVGCGAGSYMLLKLARSGPAEMGLVDFDTVEVANLSRTAYEVDDVGRLKVEALADHIRQANPFVAVRTLAADICHLSETEQEGLAAGVDLLIAGTDHFPAQALINQWSQRWLIPAVFVGVHQGARGGRVVWSLPGQTPCYRCVAWQRYEEFAQGGLARTDLPGAHGLLVDVQFIDTLALKVSLAILERGQESAAGTFFGQMGQRNEIIVRTSPDYSYGAALWDAILGDLPTQPKDFAREIQEQALFALDTVWLASEYLPGCPDCGGGSTRREAA